MSKPLVIRAPPLALEEAVAAPTDYTMASCGQLFRTNRPLPCPAPDPKGLNDIWCILDAKTRPPTKELLRIDFFHLLALLGDGSVPTAERPLLENYAES
jgi:hypothetical protein